MCNFCNNCAHTLCPNCAYTSISIQPMPSHLRSTRCPHFSITPPYSYSPPFFFSFRSDDLPVLPSHPSFPLPPTHECITRMYLSSPPSQVYTGITQDFVVFSLCPWRTPIYIYNVCFSASHVYLAGKHLEADGNNEP